MGSVFFPGRVSASTDPCGSVASSTWRGDSSDRAINPRSHQRLDPTKSRDSDLPRKEVIQPHLPVRLPCYDLVLIASPTFDGSIPQGVRSPASGIADFHDLTGGVYKARERIHRDVADSRLLAIPPSWSRVTDSNPN